MLSRLLLRIPWGAALLLVAGGAVTGAVLLFLLAGPYFQRTYRNDADPLAATRPAPTTAAPSSASGAGATGSPVPMVANPPPTGPAAATAQLLREGSFRDGDPGHNGEGRARLIRAADGGYVLRLEEFSVTNGPDLFVILSTDPSGSRGSATAGDALNLGKLKATDGNINYLIPEGTEVSAFQSVIIYCRAFRVVFAIATLEASS